MGKNKTVNCSSGFDGKALTGGIMLIILLFLLIFGSTDIEDLTDAPE
ncbi:hypothetical protein [Halalkalibacter lacteus]